MSNCKGCNAEIKWIKTRYGKNHPVDVKPKKMWVEFDSTWLLIDTYETHFATCAKAKDFKK